MPPRRAAAESNKAQDAAAIATSESKEIEAENALPVKRPRGRPRKEKKPEPIANNEYEDDDAKGSDDVAAAQKAEIDNILIDWTDDLTFAMITAIESDEEIRDGLFPGVGAIKRTGGKPKTHFYYKVAVALFAEHPLYTDVFAIDPEQKAALRSQQRKLGIEKIKNKINTLIKKGKENITMMGQTGAGLENEEEIEPGSGLATKWDVIKADSPWFFNMRDLIAARPNLQPVGLGNNNSGFDIDLLLRTHDGDDTSSAAADDTQDLPSQLSDPVDISSESDDEDLLTGPTMAGSSKRKREEMDSKPKDPATSRPAAPALPTTKKPLNAKERFSATILAEEKTTQLALGLKREKNNAHKEVALAKIQADTEVRLAKEKGKADSKREERAGKLELYRLKLEHEHQLRMAQMQAGPSSMSFSGSTGSSHAGASFTSMFDEFPRLPTPSSDSDLDLRPSTYSSSFDNTHFTQR
ncbi:hypothetical protein B0H19DRAFT_1335159 [Mycena capillaripes]|nr:hypothetical protein B0H19DRAFT_1335159 [Mycena capillaripes]